MTATFVAMSRRERETWDRHWRALEGESTLFGSLASLVRKGILRRAVRHYAEINRLTSRDHARRMVLAGGLEPVAVDFSFRDCFIHMVVVARKPLP